jgi:hypothetical protein
VAVSNIYFLSNLYIFRVNAVQQADFDEVYNVEGGIHALAAVDPAIPTY